MNFHVSGKSLTPGSVRAAAFVLCRLLSRTQMLFEDEDTLINAWALTELRDLVQHTSWPCTQQHCDVIKCQVKRSLGVLDNISPCSEHWKEMEVRSGVNRGKTWHEVASICLKALPGGGERHLSHYLSNLTNFPLLTHISHICSCCPTLLQRK